MDNTAPFKTWLRNVDAVLNRRVGLISEDLPDWDYWTAWANGYSPAEAAKLAAQEAVKW